MRRDIFQQRAMREPAESQTLMPNASPPRPAVESSPKAHAPTLPARIGRYEVLFELARGGMGTVYVARLRAAHGFERIVALKVIRQETDDPEHVRAFLREARVAARINHPNVVQTLELGEESGEPFMVLELVFGVSLARLLEVLRKRGGVIPCELAAWIVAQVSAGVHAAHELRADDGRPLGLVHRDISPHNVLLSYEGRVYVTDFGVAKFETDGVTTQTGVIKGKFAYMSPEQARAQPLDRRSDVFSLGVTLYEALAGVRPFGGGSPAETLLHIVERDPRPLREVRSDLPEGLHAIVERALRRKMEERYATADDLAADLRAFLRARKTIDESDLAALMNAECAADRDSFTTRLREGTQRVTPSSTPAALARDRQETSSTVDQRPVAKRRIVLASAIVGGALLIGGVALRLASRDGVRDENPRLPSSTEATTRPNELPNAVPSAALSSDAGPPIASTTAAPVVSVAPEARKPVARPPIPPRTPSRSSSNGVPASSSAGSVGSSNAPGPSNRGQPFDKL